VTGGAAPLAEVSGGGSGRAAGGVVPIGGAERATRATVTALVAALTVLPAGRLLLEALAPAGRLDPALAIRVLGEASVWRAARHTLEASLLATALAVLLGGAFALLLGLTDLRGRRALGFAFVVPLLIAPQVTALAWQAALGPGSALLDLVGLAPAPGAPHPLHSPGGVALVLGLQHAPLAFLAIRAGLRGLPGELVEAARVAGARPGRVLRSVVIPLTGPAWLAGAALAFVSAVGNFGIPALLGIPAGYTVLTTLIYQRLAGFGPSVLGEVALVAMLAGILAAAGVGLHAWLAGRLDVRAVALAPPVPWRLGRSRPWVEAAAWLTLGSLVALPILSLLGASLIPAPGVALRPQSATLAHYGYVLGQHAATRRAFANSLWLAGLAALALALLAVVLAYFLEWRASRLLRLVGLLLELPYAVPGVVLAIAMILLFLRPLPLIGVTLYGTPAIILAAYLSRFLALALRPVQAGYRALDPALEEAARTSGARFGRRLRTVILPLLAPAAAAGAVLAFLTAFSELTVSALLWSSGSETLGVLVFSLEQGGDSVSAAAVAMVSVVVTLGLMGLASLALRRLPYPVLPWQG
jgi:iron(III) transport system permease protein